ncbi:MAG: site-specific DNA-methyltransferase [Candidatus Gracilibacteria bacterium]
MTNSTMDGNSANPQSELLERLRADFPEVFSDGKVDPDKLRSTLGDFTTTSSERYGLSWAGKTDCFRHIQEPTTETLRPDRESSVDWDTTKNLFIEGDNLETLKVLQKAYYGKVKMIYIDPPYNTGSDSFVYPDKFQESKGEYESRAGNIDAEGNLTRDGFWRKNTKDSGHYHSNWLSMIYPRLFLARNLLRNDGVIFVSIDDNEVHNLRMVMDEIFGEENFVSQMIWQKRKGGGNDSRFLAVDHEYILVYGKSLDMQNSPWRVSYEKEYLKRYKDEDETGRFYWDTLSRPGLNNPIIYDVTCPDGTVIKDGTWQISKETFAKALDINEVKFEKNKNNTWTVFRKVRMPIGRVFRSIISEETNTDSANEISDIFGGKIFDTPKPVELIKRLVQLSQVRDQDIVLDFFAGSGTTAHAVMELNAEDDGNRRCISVQLPEAVDEDSAACRAGYKTIADISRERIRRAGQKIRETNPGKSIDTGFRAFRLSSSCFKQWQTTTYSTEELEQQMIDFIDTNLPEADDEDRLFELLIKSGYDPHVAIDKQDGYYSIAGGELIVVLGIIDQTVSRKILSEKPTKVISLDTSFGGNDVLKTNILIEAEGMGVEWKVI